MWRPNLSINLKNVLNWEHLFNLITIIANASNMKENTKEGKEGDRNVKIMRRQKRLKLRREKGREVLLL